MTTYASCIGFLVNGQLAWVATMCAVCAVYVCVCVCVCVCVSVHVRMCMHVCIAVDVWICLCHGTWLSVFCPILTR